MGVGENGRIQPNKRNDMNAQTIEIINRILPILLLLMLGIWIRRTQFLDESVMAGLNKIIVNLALPAVLFVSFLQVDFQPSFLVIFVVVILLCLLMLGLGRFLHPRLQPDQAYFPFLMTGFEYGMLGVSLFGSAYGLANLGYIAVISLGHEIFIWFMFLPLLLMKRDGIQKFSQLLQSFLKSPVIIGILGGIIFSLLGLRDALYEWPVTGGVISALEFLSNLTIPLILLVVGYGIKLERAALAPALRIVSIRLGILVPLVLILNRILIRGLLHLERPYEMALFILVILPPPFIVPLFMRPDAKQERQQVNNVLALYTLISIAVFAIYFMLNPTV